MILYFKPQKALKKHVLRSHKLGQYWRKGCGIEYYGNLQGAWHERCHFLQLESQLGGLIRSAI